MSAINKIEVGGVTFAITVPAEEVVIPKSRWNNKTAVLTKEDGDIIGTITASSKVQVVYNDESALSVVTGNVRAKSVSLGSIAFECENTPQEDLIAIIQVMS